MKKKNTRRSFLESSLKVGAFLPFAGASFQGMSQGLIQHNPTQPAPNKPLKILILGGTSFLGPHQIAYAMDRGHTISTFTRGKTLPTIHTERFKDVEQLIGDRANNLEALKGKKWDAVIDNSGQRVAWTKDTAELLKDQADLYQYTSSTGVYYPYLGSDIKEDTKLLTKEPDTYEHEDEKLEYWYGVMKTNSEIAARKSFGEERSIIVRPTYMIGPGDKTDRFIHWPVRLSKGGEVLVPGKKEDPVQLIDVRDVAQWMIRLLEQKAAGTYNAVGPASPLTMQQFVYGAHAAFSAPVSYVNIDDYEFLKKHKVPYLVPWVMPEGKNYGSSLVSNRWAIENGLTYTPLASSVRDIHDWWYSDALTEERRQKFEGKKGSVLLEEKNIIAAWRKKG